MVGEPDYPEVTAKLRWSEFVNFWPETVDSKMLLDLANGHK